MLEALGRQLIQSGFLPHGYCLNWSPPLVGTYIFSDALIALSYFSMPVAMAYFGWKRRDFPYKWMLWMFVAFILSCGTTHLMGTVILYQPAYWLDATLRVITGVVSAATAIALWPMIPKALRVPSHEQMRAINEELQQEIVERRRIEGELKRAHEELKELHRLTGASLTSALHRLDAHMGNSPLAIVEFDPEFRVMRWSEAAEELFGWRADEVVGKAIADFRWVHEDDVEKLARISAAMLSGTSPRNKNINRNYCKDGTVVHCEWYNSAIYDERGHLVSILSQVLDITERERVAEQIRASEEKYRTLFSNMTEAFALGEMIFNEQGVPTSGRFLEVNEAFYRQTGIPRGIEGRPIREYLPNLESSWVERCSAVARTGQAQRFDSYNADTRRFYDVYIFSPTPGRFAILFRDITEQKHMAVALREGEEKLQLFIHYAPAALAMFDQKMRYLAASRRWLDDFFLAEDIAGRSHYELVPDIPERWKEIHRRALAGEVLRADEDRFERADGSVQWKRWEVRPWHTGEGAIGGIVIFSEDITRYKQAVDEIKRLNSDLEQRVEERTAELKAANQELDSFAYAVSHDLRAPLRAINGFSQILEEGYVNQLSGDALRYLQQIRLSSRKMSDLIDGILTLSRITRDEPQRDEVDLSAMAQRLLEGLAAAEPQRQVKWEVEPGLMTWGDVRMVESVMTNLIDNAWKYTARTPEAFIRVYREGENFCVADNGAGFDPNHMEKLFQPFQRLHGQGEFPGIGIGLATVKRIVQRHGGDISATAAVRGGATFRFNLGSYKPVKR